MNTMTQQMEPGQWVEYFDVLAPSLEGLLVTIEVMSEQLGDQIDVERLPLQTIGYDHKDKVLEIAVGGRGVRYPVLLRHFIYNPQTISIAESGSERPSAILITDAGGVRTLIRLFESPALE
jgi:hypothetical protein